jgi:hypothetical protein
VWLVGRASYYLQSSCGEEWSDESFVVGDNTFTAKKLLYRGRNDGVKVWACMAQDGTWVRANFVGHCYSNMNI